VHRFRPRTRTLDFELCANVRYDGYQRSAERFGVGYASESRMKRTIYSALMSIFFGVVAGAIATDVINIMYPDFGLDYKLAIAFFSALSWALLTLIGLIFSRS
jgi:hypothetical protein